MTGNTLTMNPITGQNPYATSAYGPTGQGFWGSTGGFGGTPFGFVPQSFQTQFPYPISQIGSFTPQFHPQAIQQPGLFNQVVPQWQTGFGVNPQMAFQSVLAQAQQCCPPEVLNAVLQTTPPQVLPYVLNALACQQVCEQVLQQNPQAVQAINPQVITQPFQTLTNRQGIGGFGTIGQPFVGGYQPIVGFQPWTQRPWAQNQGILSGLGQVQQPAFANAFGTW
jgi:hypothetical protein